MDQSEQDQQQFEQVLSRLDALMKRGQSAQEPPPLVASPLDDASTGAQTDALGPDSRAWLSADPEPEDVPQVPVLTEIYDPAEEGIPVLQDALVDDADIEQAILERWMPALRQAMDEIVEAETRRFSEGLQQRLHQQVADALRQHIRALKGQTDM